MGDVERRELHCIWCCVFLLAREAAALSALAAHVMLLCVLHAAFMHPFLPWLPQQSVDLPPCSESGRGVATMAARLQLLQEAAAAATRASALLEAAALQADLAEEPPELQDEGTEDGGSPILCAQAKSQGRRPRPLRTPSPSRWAPQPSPAFLASVYPVPPPPPPPSNRPVDGGGLPPPLRLPPRAEAQWTERRRSRSCRSRRRGQAGTERGRGSKLGKRLYGLVRGGARLVAELASQCEVRPEQIRQSVKASPKLALGSDDRVAVAAQKRGPDRARAHANEQGADDRRRRRGRDSESTTS